MSETPSTTAIREALKELRARMEGFTRGWHKHFGDDFFMEQMEEAEAELEAIKEARRRAPDEDAGEAARVLEDAITLLHSVAWTDVNGPRNNCRWCHTPSGTVAHAGICPIGIIGNKIAEERAAIILSRPQEDEGPRELLCMVCHHDYPVWFAPNELWNRVMRTPDGRETSETIPYICPTCFGLKAHAMGVRGAFMLSEEGGATEQEPEPTECEACFNLDAHFELAESMDEVAHPFLPGDDGFCLVCHNHGAHPWHQEPPALRGVREIERYVESMGWRLVRSREQVDRPALDLGAVAFGPDGYDPMDAVEGVAARMREYHADTSHGSVMILTIGRDRCESYWLALEAAAARLRSHEQGEPVAWMVQCYVPEQGGWQNNDPWLDEERAAREARSYRSEPHSIPARVIPLVPLAPATEEPKR